jgi:hypothetical protein
MAPVNSHQRLVLAERMPFPQKLETLPIDGKI